MLQVARLAPTMLGEAAPRIVDFFHSQFQHDGGVADRAGQPDLYYTVFGLEGLLALREPLPELKTRDFLSACGDGSDLDFVHTACLARCWACLSPSPSAAPLASSLAARIEACRSADGGYAATPGAKSGTIYHCFLAQGLYEDLGLALPDASAMVACISGLRTRDGAFANGPDMPVGTTPSTAAAVTLLRRLGAPVPPEAGQWLLDRAHPQGGFTAVPGIDMPDLLSTATALHALSGMHVPFTHLQESCLDFLDTLWTGKAFCGSWADDAEDCEYTYYALLALGHLSL